MSHCHLLNTVSVKIISNGGLCRLPIELVSGFSRRWFGYTGMLFYDPVVSPSFCASGKRHPFSSYNLHRVPRQTWSLRCVHNEDPSLVYLNAILRIIV